MIRLTRRGITGLHNERKVYYQVFSFFGKIHRFVELWKGKRSIKRFYLECILQRIRKVIVRDWSQESDLLIRLFCRHVPQLSRVTLKFCKNTRMSKGARDFIENDLVDFCREHPGIAFYVTARRMKSPVLVCEYLNGSYHWQSVHAMSRQKIKLWLDFYASRCGEPIKVIRKPTTSVWPSVQGPWNPFLNKPTECNIMQFPNEERGRFISRKVSATEQLSQMAKNGQLKNILFSKKES